MIAADTNIFVYAANPASEKHDAATRFFASFQTNPEFVVCELVLIELYMQLRNPTVMPRPLGAPEAARFCLTFKQHPVWQHVDYSPEVSAALWQWVATPGVAFRRVVDARLASTLRHHGVLEFATANVKDFQGFGFQRVWNPVAS